MPKESTKVSKSKDVVEVDDVDVVESNQEQDFIHINDFDVNKLVLPPIDEKRSSDSRYHAFPTYQYGKRNDKITIITDEIKLTKGGIPKLDDKWRKNDSKREFFWLAWDKEQPACNALFEKLKELDEKFDQNISYDSDSKEDHNLETKTVHFLKDKKKEPLTVLEYSPIVRMSVQGGDGEQKPDQKEYEPYERIKVKFQKKWDKNKQEGDLSELTTLLYLGENEEPENLTYPSDFEKYLRWNCTAKFVFQINKFQCKKAIEKDKKGKQQSRDCGFDITVCQVAITKEAPTSGSNADKYRKRMFPKLGAVPTQKPTVVEAEKKQKDESSDESGSESESENESKSSKSSESEEKPKQQTKKKEVEKKQEPKKDTKSKKVDSESESESNESESNESESEKSDSEDSSSEEQQKSKAKSKKASR
jgi:hypothetical protein